MRLARIHRVHPRRLIVSQVLPLLDRPYLHNADYHSLSSFWKHNSRALNGIGLLARDWVAALESLTLCDDLSYLTMLTWSEVLPARGLLRQSRAWCPWCYHDWRQQEQDIYDPLLWALDVVEICSIHQRRLVQHCPHCKKHLPYLAPQSRVGYCPLCNKWLGMSSPEMTQASDIATTEDLLWQSWVVEAMSGLLTVAPDFALLPARERMSEAISLCVDHLTDGDATAFVHELQASNIQLSKWSVWDWRRGKQLPQLGIFLKICCYLGTTPLELLTGHTPSLVPPPFDFPEDNNGTAKKSIKSFDADKLKCELETFAASESLPPPSMAEVARHLGHDHSHLRKLFPDLCVSISERYWTYQRTQAKIRKQRVRDEVRRVMMQIHGEKKYPSRRQVRKLLSNSNLMRLPEAQETWRTVLLELGYNQAGSDVSLSW